MNKLKSINKIYILISFLLYMFACKQNKQSENISKSTYLEDKNQVKIMVLQPDIFTKQLVSNGKLAALQKSDLQFMKNGRILSIKAKNGQRVKKDELIASIEPFDSKQELKKAENDFRKTEFDFQDVLIGMGYNPEDTANIPKDKMQLAHIKSGYAQANTNLDMAHDQLQNCNLIAPFSGIVANIKSKPYESSSNSAFCTLIDDSEFDVSFQILETELANVKIKSPVKVIPFSMDNKIYTGTVSEINPVVDENGLIQIKALVKNPGELMEGMNVKVLIEKEIPNQFVVPKSAVVLRDNYEVLFKVVNGIAYWNYVETVLENTNQYTVRPNRVKSSSKLNPGDTIIISGNLNLAHESAIEIVH